VDIFSDPKVAINAISETDYDLVVSDIRMPVISAKRFFSML
jgi:YesN/AraC family two-component response regulator